MEEKIIDVSQPSHLGDIWANINFCIRKANVKKITFTSKDKKKLDFVKRVVNLLNIKGKNIYFENKSCENGFRDVFRGKIPQWDRDKIAYACKYYPVKKNKKKRDEKKICFSFEGGNKNAICGRWMKKEGFSKLPKNTNTILTEFEGFNFVKMGLPMEIEEIAEHLSSCLLYVGIDNGITHIARSVGCKILILQHEWPVEHAFPLGVSNYVKCNSVNEAIKNIRNEINKKKYI